MCALNKEGEKQNFAGRVDEQTPPLLDHKILQVEYLNDFHLSWITRKKSEIQNWIGEDESANEMKYGHIVLITYTIIQKRE